MVGAFHRNVITNLANINNSSAFYPSGPCDWYAAFFHTINIKNLAYGFAFDDTANQSTTIECDNPRAIVIALSPWQ